MLSLLVIIVVASVNLILTVLITVAFMTLLERKIIGGTQNRKGPNVVGLFGLLQPITDALKLIFKETILPRSSKLLIFLVSPAVSLIFALLAWAVVPLDYNVVLSDINLGVLFIFAISILHIYGIILAGWSSGSRYSFLGAMRSSAQLLAYDIAMGVTFACIVVFTKSLNLTEIVAVQDKTGWFVFYLFFLFVMFFICALAETNRHPFDLPEAESELVGGYFTEYSSAIFALFYLGEYSSIMLMCVLMTHLFFGGWLPLVNWNLMGLNHPFFWFSLKLLLLYYIFVIVRAAIPRYRYDQLMRIGWKYILPLSFAFFVYLILVEVGVQLLFSDSNVFAAAGIHQSKEELAYSTQLAEERFFARGAFFRACIEDWRLPALRQSLRIVYPSIIYCAEQFQHNVRTGESHPILVPEHSIHCTTSYISRLKEWNLACLYKFGLYPLKDNSVYNTNEMVHYYYLLYMPNLSIDLAENEEASRLFDEYIEAKEDAASAAVVKPPVKGRAGIWALYRKFFGATEAPTPPPESAKSRRLREFVESFARTNPGPPLNPNDF